MKSGTLVRSFLAQSTHITTQQRTAWDIFNHSTFHSASICQVHGFFRRYTASMLTFHSVSASFTSTASFVSASSSSLSEVEAFATFATLATLVALPVAALLRLEVSGRSTGNFMAPQIFGKKNTPDISTDPLAVVDVFYLLRSQAWLWLCK